MLAITITRPPHPRHRSISIANTRFKRCGLIQPRRAAVFLLMF